MFLGFLTSPTFFFYCARPPRLLRSFPTRRSSDLLPSQLVHARRRRTVPMAGVRREPARPQMGHRTPAIGTVRRDRKSTRLNSSHQIISYAVFCLKKKRTQIRKTLLNNGQRIHECC